MKQKIENRGWFSYWVAEVSALDRILFWYYSSCCASTKQTSHSSCSCTSKRVMMGRWLSCARFTTVLVLLFLLCKQQANESLLFWYYSQPAVNCQPSFCWGDSFACPPHYIHALNFHTSSSGFVFFHIFLFF